MRKHAAVPAKPELWGGVECTVNRVHDRYFEQMGRSGHLTRPSDLDRFAALGIKAIRQPVLWETTAPDRVEDADWTWSDAWLNRIRELQLRPIIGLVHHGGGPPHTSLVDPDFPDKLADYAGAVARRYPWVEDYTPVNEILTTARFSGLYGFWYPHGTSELTFATALLNECRATVMAMRAIRAVNPRARLIQTDDLGKVFSTPRLRYQAEFENLRRWLGWDLLCGMVRRPHRMWGHLAHTSVLRDQLQWLVDNPCPPDVIGVNHYLSSDRFLDENLSRYPHERVGSNGRDQYVDILAARVRSDGPAGAYTLLRETWERYRIPVAVTEVHNGCTREEQLRWFVEVWDAAERLCSEGVPVPAVTAWALLGAFDWHTLVTHDDNHYEPGVFDIRSPEPRETAIGHAMRQLANGVQPDHPVLDSPGWWRRAQRLIYGHAVTNRGRLVRRNGPQALVSPHSNRARPILITGGRGTLGRALERACIARGLEHRLLVRSEMDIAHPEAVSRLVDELRPWAVINAAGYVRVDDAEADAERCYRENTEGPAVLAAECERRGIRLVTYSTDLVFDGTKGEPYVESDFLAPLNVYGRSKALAEQRVLESCANAMVIRTSAFFGPWDHYNFVTIALRTIATGQVFRAASDAIVSPTYVPDLVNATLDLLIDGETGIWHLANAGQISWADFARQSAAMAGLDPAYVYEMETADMGLAAERPLVSALRSERAWIMPSLHDALSRYMRDAEARWAAPEVQLPEAA